MALLGTPNPRQSSGYILTPLQFPYKWRVRVKLTCKTPAGWPRSWARGTAQPPGTLRGPACAPCTPGRVRRLPPPPVRTLLHRTATVAPRYTARSPHSSSACWPPPITPHSAATELPRTPARWTGCSLPPPSSRRDADPLHYHSRILLFSYTFVDCRVNKLNHIAGIFGFFWNDSWNGFVLCLKQKG